MEKSDFEESFKFILSVEGGYHLDPNDPGGATKFGISKKAFPEVNIKELTLENAKAIYKREYWDLMNCDKFDFDLALALFDGGVNQGVPTAKKFLQRALDVKEDGIFGPVTLKAYKNKKGNNLFLNYLSYRILKYSKTKKFDHYGHGWILRVLHLIHYCFG